MVVVKVVVPGITIAAIKPAGAAATATAPPAHGAEPVVRTVIAGSSKSTSAIPMVWLAELDLTRGGGKVRCWRKT